MYNMYIYTIYIYIYIAYHFPRIIRSWKVQFAERGLHDKFSLSLCRSLSLSLIHTPSTYAIGLAWAVSCRSLSFSLSLYLFHPHYTLSAFTRSIRHELRLSARALSLSSLSPPLSHSPSCSHTQHVHGRANMSCVISHSVCLPICLSVCLSQHVRNRADTSCAFRPLSHTHRHTQTLPLYQPTRSDKHALHLLSVSLTRSRFLWISLSVLLAYTRKHLLYASTYAVGQAWAASFFSLSRSLSPALSLFIFLYHTHTLSLPARARSGRDNLLLFTLSLALALSLSLTHTLSVQAHTRSGGHELRLFANDDA